MGFLRRSLLASVVLLNLTGCEQVSGRLQDLFGNPSPQKALAKMESLVSEGQAEKALSEGESFVAKNSDPNNIVREELVRLYLERGRASDALRHMQAMTPGGSAPEPRSAANHQTPASEQQDGKSSVSVDGASARAGPGGTEVRAGDAVIKIGR